ncbi:MAG: signal peptidase I [Nitrosomonas sp.]
MEDIRSLKALFWFSGKMDVLYEHLCRQYKTYILLLITYLAISLRYEFAVNVSRSLPGTLYLIEKGELPQRGEYVAFNYQSNFLYPQGTRFLKRVMGAAGDSVQSRDHKYYVNGTFVGEAKPATSTGQTILELGFNGVIPAGHYYTMADHPLSLDSRYQAVGLVSASHVIGKAFKLF